MPHTKSGPFHLTVAQIIRGYESDTFSGSGVPATTCAKMASVLLDRFQETLRDSGVMNFDGVMLSELRAEVENP